MTLPDEVLARIRESITEGKRMIPQIEADIRDAQRAGIDVSEQLARLAEAKQRLTKVEAVYGERVTLGKRSTKLG